jgi:hypothetical protein
MGLDVVWPPCTQVFPDGQRRYGSTRVRGAALPSARLCVVPAWRTTSGNLPVFGTCVLHAR